MKKVLFVLAVLSVLTINGCSKEEPGEDIQRIEGAYTASDDYYTVDLIFSASGEVINRRWSYTDSGFMEVTSSKSGTYEYMHPYIYVTFEDWLSKIHTLKISDDQRTIIWESNPEIIYYINQTIK